MRTMSLIGLFASGVLVLAMLTQSQIMLWIVFGTHVLCLLKLARNDDALVFVIEHTRLAMVLELFMFATAAITLVLFMNQHVYLSALSAVAYAVCWYMLLTYAPPYSADFGMFAPIPEDLVDDDC